MCWSKVPDADRFSSSQSRTFFLAGPSGRASRKRRQSASASGEAALEQKRPTSPEGLHSPPPAGDSKKQKLISPRLVSRIQYPYLVLHKGILIVDVVWGLFKKMEDNRFICRTRTYKRVFSSYKVLGHGVHTPRTPTILSRLTDILGSRPKRGQCIVCCLSIYVQLCK